MPDYVINPPWWVLLFLSVFLAKRWDSVERHIGSTANFFMNHTRGKLRGLWRKRRLKHAKNERYIRANKLSITHTIIKSQTYLILFALSGITTAGFLATASVAPSALQSQFIFLSIVAACPGFIFEILWLTNSSRATKYIKFFNSLHATTKLTKLKSTKPKVTRAEIESHILKAALLRTGRKEQNAAGSYYLNNYDYYEDYEIEYFDKNKDSGKIRIYSLASTDTFHFKLISTDSPTAICLVMDAGSSEKPQLDRLI